MFPFDTTTVGDTTYTAVEVDDDPVFADDLTIEVGVTVSVTAGDLVLRAGDDIVLAGSASASNLLSLQAAFGDLDFGGSIVQTGGSLTAPRVALSALTGIGASLSPITVATTNLEAQSSTGGIHISVLAGVPRNPFCQPRARFSFARHPNAHNPISRSSSTDEAAALARASALRGTRWPP